MIVLISHRMSTHINVAACVSAATGCSEYGKVERIWFNHEVQVQSEVVLFQRSPILVLLWFLLIIFVIVSMMSVLLIAFIV